MKKQPKVDWRPVARQVSDAVQSMFRMQYGFSPNDANVLSSGIFEFMPFYEGTEGTNVPDATLVLQADISTRI